MNQDSPEFAAARERAKRQLRATGINPELPGWIGLLDSVTKQQLKAAVDSGADVIKLSAAAEQFIARFAISCFYHFTDSRNLASIRKRNGLLSCAELIRQNIPVVAPGGNEWSHDADVLSGVDDYIHLCFLDDHPMEYLAKQDGRIVQSVYLQVVPEVIGLEGVMFAPDVSNKSGVKLLPLEEAVRNMDFEVIYDHTDWRDPAVQARRKIAKKYELLVPRHVPSSLIRGL